MRPLLALLALLGLAGMVFGVVTIVQHWQYQPFRFETYGGPGSMIGGLLLMCLSLYLLISWPGIEPSSRGVHHR